MCMCKYQISFIFAGRTISPKKWRNLLTGGVRQGIYFQNCEAKT